MTSGLRLLLLLTTLTLASCSGGGGGESAGHSPFGKPNMNCDHVITQQTLDAFLASGAVPDIGNVEGYGFAKCEVKTTVNGQTKVVTAEGYVFVAYSPSIVLGSTYEIERKGEWLEARIPVTFTEIDDQDLAAMKEWFRNQTGEVPLFEKQSPDWTAVLVGSLPEEYVDFKDKIEANGTTSKVMEIGPSNIRAFESEIKKFTQGNATITFVRGSEQKSESMQVAEFSRGELVAAKNFEPLSKSAFIDNLWQRLKTHPESLRLSDYALQKWMMRVETTWKSLGISPMQAQERWYDAWALAVRTWSPPENPNSINDHSDRLRVLRWLSVVHPKSAADYVSYLRKLDPYLSSNSKDFYSEIIELVQRNPYSKDQENFIFNLAEELLKAKVSDNPRAWPDAKSLAIGTNYSQPKVNHILAVASWIATSGRERDSLELAQRLVVENNVDSDRLKFLKELSQWLENQDVRSPFDKTMEYVLERDLNDEQIMILRETTQWLKTTSEKYRALQRAEDYLFKNNLTPEQIRRIQELAGWLMKTDDKHRAVSKAEAYVIEKQISADQASALMFAWDFLLKTDDKYRALSKAEGYILEKNLSRANVESLKRVYEWLMKTDEKYRALSHAEEFVIVKKLSAEQLQVLMDSHDWLLKTDDKYRAFRKATEYVVEKGMTLDIFNRLKLAFDKYKKAGDYRALEKAEREVLG